MKRKIQHIVLSAAILGAVLASNQAMAMYKICFKGTIRICNEFGCITAETGEEVCFDQGGGGGGSTGGTGGSTGGTGGSTGGTGGTSGDSTGGATDAGKPDPSAP